jgi:putative SOS response-associated peptidase YedK
MCGRYYIETGFDAKLDGLLRRTHVTRPSADPYQGDTRDVCPSDRSLIIHASYDIGGHVMTTAMRWGFTNPYGSGLLINARAETALEKKTFADSLLKRRCIIPASGFMNGMPTRRGTVSAIPTTVCCSLQDVTAKKRTARTSPS